MVERQPPMLEGTKIQEAPRYSFTCLWCAYGVAQHYCSIARQLIIHQPFSIRRQEMHIL